MKTIFYMVVFLFLTVLAQAQSTITYVSFFPPKGIAHKDVVLVQDANSFKASDLESNTNTGDYSARSGGLILGGFHDASIEISSMTIKSRDANLPYTIAKITADNMLDVEANGIIDTIKIGVFAKKEGDLVCTENYVCDTVLLSAYTLSFPLKTKDVFNVGTLNVRSSGRAELSNLQILNSNNNAYYNFLPTKIPDYPNSNIADYSVHTISNSDSITLGWRELRVNGSEECRKYLVLNPSSGSGGCRDPQDQAGGGTGSD